MENVKCVLLDIEGTVCPISFVKQTLFPYAINALPNVLARKWDDAVFQPYRDAFPEEHRKDPVAFRAHVEDLTQRDVKVAYLKNLQGFLWEDGYRTGAYSTALFPDVVPALRRWKDAGYTLAIYSSGSVFAQKLLFGHVQRAADATPTSTPKKRVRTEDDDSTGERDDVSGHVEDLTGLFQDWFDTVNAGLKTESGSYSKIAEALQLRPDEILFLSDSVREVDAAIAASTKSILVDRPGNAPLDDSDRDRLHLVESLSQIQLSS